MSNKACFLNYLNIDKYNKRKVASGCGMAATCPMPRGLCEARREAAEAGGAGRLEAGPPTACLPGTNQVRR